MPDIMNGGRQPLPTLCCLESCQGVQAVGHGRTGHLTESSPICTSLEIFPAATLRYATFLSYVNAAGGFWWVGRWGRGQGTFGCTELQLTIAMHMEKLACIPWRPHLMTSFHPCSADEPRIFALDFCHCQSCLVQSADLPWRPIQSMSKLPHQV